MKRENNITVKEFVDLLLESPDTPIDSVIEVKKYLPIYEKKGLIESIISEILEEKNLYVSYDSIRAEILFTMGCIYGYTSLEPSGSDDYDLLCSSGLLPDILSLIEEYDIFHTLFERRVNDYIRDRNSTGALLNAGLNTLLNIVTDKLDPKLLEQILEAYQKHE